MSMTPSPIRRAATVILLRCQGQAPPEVLLVRRAKTLSFMADSYAFPGGRVEDSDLANDPARATWLAARRETEEEVGITLPPVPESLALFSRWLTPSLEPRRYDTDFFVGKLPPDQLPRVDGGEIVDHLFLPLTEALRRFDEGALKLPPPTLSNLEELLDLWLSLGEDANVDGLLLTLLKRPPPVLVLPKLVPHAEGGLAIVMPWAQGFEALAGEGTPLPVPTQLPGGRKRTERVLLLQDGHFKVG